MLMQFLYLSIIPTLIAISMLFFNKDFRERYEKKSISILFVLLIGQLISIIREVWFMYNSPNNMSSLKYLIALSGVYISAPILVLYVNKVYKVNTFFRSKWFRVVLSILWLALIWFISVIF